MPNRAPDYALKGGGLAYASVAASAALTNSTTETTLDSHAFAAGELKAGDVVEVMASGIATATNSTDTLTVKLKFGTTVILATAALDATDNDTWFLHAYVTIRTDGASGTFVSTGSTNIGVEGTATHRNDIVASTAIDTTAALTFAVTGTWSAASASDSCRNDHFLVWVHKPRTQG